MMKLIIEKEKILSQLKKHNKIIDKNSPRVILQNILIDISDKKLKMITSNGATTVISYIQDVDTNDEFKVLLNCQTLLDSISKMDSDIVNIEFDNRNLSINGNKRKYKLNIMNCNDFPNFEKYNDVNNVFVIKLNDFLRGFICTYKMTSKKETRPILTGVNLKGNKDNNFISFVSTDSYRLAKIELPTIGELKNDIDMTIPCHFIEYIISVFENGDELLNVCYGEKGIMIEYDNMIIQSNLINGQYPNTERILLGDKDIIVKIDKKHFEDIIDCSIFKEIKNYIISMDFQKDCVVLSNRNVELGEFEERYEIEYDKEPMKISVNGDYLKQALKTFDSQYIEMKFEKNGLKPFIINGCEDKDNELIQLLMPLRILD